MVVDNSKTERSGLWETVKQELQRRGKNSNNNTSSTHAALEEPEASRLVQNKKSLPSQNDSESVELFKQGNNHYLQKDYAYAELFWKKAYALGHRSAGACLAMIIYGNKDSQMPSYEKFMRQLIYMTNNGNGWVMMLLGIINCGGTHQWTDTFPPEQFEAFNDPTMGFQAIENGVLLAEQTDAQPKLTYHDYFYVAEVYRKYENWQKSVDYLQKALDIMTEIEKQDNGKVIEDLINTRKNILHGKITGTVAPVSDKDKRFNEEISKTKNSAYKDKLYLKSLVSDIYVGNTTMIKIMNLAINEGLAVDLADLLCLDESRQEMEFNKIVSRFASSYGMDKDFAKEAVRSLGLGVGLKLGIM